MGSALLSLCLLFAPAATAQVTTTNRTIYYRVSGTTAKALLSNLLRHPVAGDHGAAFANIRPTYSLDVQTAATGGLCRPAKVQVRISFRTTLPQAEGRLGGSTASAWKQFVDFATRHEQWHQRSYTACAERFVRAAKKQAAPSCSAVSSITRRMFRKARRDCEAEQLAFDRREKAPLSRLRLFRMAGY